MGVVVRKLMSHVGVGLMSEGDETADESCECGADE